MHTRSAPSPNTQREQLAKYFQALVAANVFFLAAIFVFSLAGFALGRHLSAWPLWLAAVATLLGLRLVTASWRSAGLVGLTSVALHLASYFVAWFFFDGSWDGLAYHQEAVLKLAEGWNPIFETLGPIGPSHELWINHYPKGSWTVEAVVLLATGHIEAAKLFNFSLMLTAGAQVVSTVLRLTTLRLTTIAVVGFIAVFNPVSIFQSTTFCVDGFLASLLTITVGALVLYLAIPEISVLFIGLVTVGLMINVKFTGLLYSIIILAVFVVAVWYRYGVRRAINLTILSAVTGAVSILLIGYTPYVRNFREEGDLFYPLHGKGTVDIITVVRPVNLTSKDRVTRFLIANFSRSEYVRPPRATRLKFPFFIYPSERDSWSEAGGFGPLFGALLVLEAVGLGLLLCRSSTRRIAFIALFISGALCLTIFGHSEGWWARYAPQAWLLPLVVAVACLSVPRPTPARWVGWIILFLASFDILFIGYYSTREKWEYTKQTNRCLHELAVSGHPVIAYVGPFLSLRERLHETGAQIQAVKAIPEGETSSAQHHPIPSPDGHAFWQE